ncbi:cellulose binding domain-containing protein [Microbispora sp. CA-135349]|uniref:poly(ethylene terephthalate) hydrolase family protein n=1 Tax=Microbispora sp. CA-135349 TaxID=3239953 RepID=UPI003D90A2E6
MPQNDDKPTRAPGSGTGRPEPGSSGRLWWRAAAAVVAVLGMLAAGVATRPASAADSAYQRGPDPTLASVSATRGTFATAEVSVPPGNGFNGGTIYFPTDTSQGTFGAVGIMPGYTARFAVEEAWMGHWLASFGFVVIGVETNSPNDWDTARATQLLAALDYLTQKSSVRTRVDANRLSVIGHSMGGGGALGAAVQRPSLKAAVGLMPFMPSGNLTNDRVPTMLISGQNDGTVTPSSVVNLYNTLPSTTESAYLELSGAGHGFPTQPNTLEMRILIPWLKTFVDDDTRYTQFLCPSLKDSTGIRTYRNTCPLVPSGGPTSSPTPSPSSSPSPVPGGPCLTSYRTVNSWPGGFQGEVTVTAGASAVNGWTVTWTLSSGQSISQVWNGTLSTSGSAVSVSNVSYNGSLQPSTSTTFGFIAAGTPSTAALTCTSP